MVGTTAAWSIVIVGGSKSFYDNCKRTIDVDGVYVGLRQGCLMSPWMFVICRDGLVKRKSEGIRRRGTVE